MNLPATVTVPYIVDMSVVPVDEALDVEELGGDRWVLRCDTCRFPGLVYLHVHLTKIDVRAGALWIFEVECCVAEVPIGILGTVFNDVG